VTALSILKRNSENYLFGDYYWKSGIKNRIPALRTTGRKRGGKGKQSNDGFGSVEANHLMPSLMIIALISGG